MATRPNDETRDLASELKRAAEAASIDALIPAEFSGITPDEPIRSSGQDRLNRTGFARELAKGVLKFTRKESLVIGIHGKWGTGKTSVLNLIEEQLEQLSEHPPLVFRFDPWGYSDQERLTAQFFRDLATFLSLHKTIPRLSTIAATVEEYGTLVTPLARLLFPRTAESVRTGWRLFRRVAPVPRNALELKARINTALASSGVKLILMLDDIDRLNAAEIRQTVQLIKMNADFSNTIYLVAFDRGPVEKALEKIAPGAARQYLEKIIQISFNLPPISEATLSQIILAEFNDLLSDNKTVDTQRFGNMFHAGFRAGFRTIRDVNRYFNLFRFVLGLIGNDTNFIDLAAMQALSLFYPDVYSGIERNSELFYGNWRMSDHRPDRESLKPVYDGVFAGVPEPGRTFAISLCRFLFPKVEYVYGSSNSFWGPDYLREWEKQRRVCSPKFFHYYFELAVPETDVSRSEFEKALKSTEELNSFLLVLHHFNDSKRLGPFIDLLRNNVEELNRNQMLVVLESILVFGDEVPSEGSNVFFGTLSEHVRFATWLLFDLLDRLGDDRFERLFQFMSARHQATFTIANTAAMFERILQDTTNPERREQKRKYPDLTADIVKSMKTAAVWAIEFASDHDRLASVPHLPFVLARWAEWNDPKRAKEWVSRTFLQTPKSAIRFASTFAHEITSMGVSDRVPKIRTVIAVKSISELADIEHLTSLILGANDNELTEDERLTKARYLAAKEKLDSGIDPVSPGALMDED